MKTIIKLIIALGLIYWLIQSGKLKIDEMYNQLSVFTLGLSLIITGLIIFVNNLRWQVLLNGIGLKKRLNQTLPLTFIGLFFNFFMPGGVGGDLVKGFYLVKDHPEDKVKAATTVILDRIVGFFGMISFGVLAIVLNWSKLFSHPSLKIMSFSILLLWTAFVTFFLFSLSRRIGGNLFIQSLIKRLPFHEANQKLYNALHTYRSSLKELILSVIITFISMSLHILFFAYVGSFFYEGEISISAYLFIVPLGLISGALPISPAGIGVGQAAFMFLFTWYLGQESSIGPNSMTAYQFCLLCWGLLGSFFYIRRKKPQIVRVATC